ncbi:MAG TPA: cobalamin-dependent protein [Bacteroidota bacterium]|nr:cobalamin-dependent protein [Bacteroidota bacterium]
MKSIYSTAELAEILNVNESTIKRWSDAGDLACMKTRGGHRRFSAGSIMEFVRQNNMSASVAGVDAFPDEDLRAHLIAGNFHRLVPEMKKEMLAGNVQGIVRMLRSAYVARPDLLALISELVFPPLVEIGEAWHAKSLSIDREHIASNSLQEALAEFSGELHRKPANGLKAVTSCSEGQWHEVAIRCVGYYLAAEGWSVVSLGQSPPTASLVHAIKTEKPDLVALSVVTPAHERALLNEVNRTICPAARRAKARLAVGGPNIKARWSGKVRADYLCDTIDECRIFSDPARYLRGHSS